MENLTESTFSDETFEDIRVTAKWMNTIGILSVILGILGVLGDLVNLSADTGTGVGLNLLLSGFGIFIAFVLINNAILLKKLIAEKNAESLTNVLISTKKYWMLSVLVIILSFVFQQFTR